MINVVIVADSVGPSGVRLTTFEFTYPRFIHAELMTHRAFSRNAASSRAIPVKKTIGRIWRHPAMPVFWGANQAGMQAAAELTGWRKWLAIKLWVLSSRIDILFAWLLMKIGLHKQISNRLLEPAMHITTIVTADQFGLANFFHQRNHKDAQPEFRELAKMAWVHYNHSVPKKLAMEQWHLPYITVDDWNDAVDKFGLVYTVSDRKPIINYLKDVSVGRCARVSYLSHNGKRDMEEDVKLANKLKTADPGHWSPFEHVCMAMPLPSASGNVRGWKQYRKEFPNEFLTELPNV